LKFSKNLKRVAQTPTNAEIGTAYFISKSKNISIIGILLPAPESPPALERAINMNIRTTPILSIIGLVKNSFCLISASAASTTSTLPFYGI